MRTRCHHPRSAYAVNLTSAERQHQQQSIPKWLCIAHHSYDVCCCWASTEMPRGKWQETWARTVEKQKTAKNALSHPNVAAINFRCECWCRGLSTGKRASYSMTRAEWNCGKAIYANGISNYFSVCHLAMSKQPLSLPHTHSSEDTSMQLEFVIPVKLVGTWLISLLSSS